MTAFELPPETESRLRELAIRSFFSSRPPEFFETEDGAHLLRQQTVQRYQNALVRMVPWAEEAVGVTGRRVVEVGSGSGSSTAAFATKARSVIGFEIDARSIAAARERLQILGIRNAEVRESRPDRFVEEVCGEIGPRDLVLFFAVLEHMTVDERLTALQAAWEQLGSGGAMVVVETPNRLTYMDRHTSHMPFFQQLPLEIAVRYYRHSPREVFVQNIDQAPDKRMALQRWGRGVSYHDFEIALGDDVHDHIVATGYERHVQWLYPVRREDEILKEYFEHLGLDKNVAFTRHPLNLILQKP